MGVTIERIKRLAPHAQGEYLAAFGDADAIMGGFGIVSGLQISHFLAQVLAETGGLRVFEENLNYSAKRLTEVWPRHFPTLEAAEPYAHDRQKLGNFIYGPQIHADLGNTEPGDGYRFRGRGMLQITGRAAYARFGQKLNVPLLDAPDLAYNHLHSLAIAAAEFSVSRYKGRTCLELADADDIVGVTHAINGGENGLPERRRALALAKPIFLPAVAQEDPGQLETPLAVAELGSRALANATLQPMA